MTKKRFKLDPNLTAMENLWEAAKAATSVLFLRSRITNKGEEIKDMYDQVVAEGVEQFMMFKIGQHKYNRNFDFFSNVYSSCWSAYSKVTKRYIADVREKIITDSADECIEGTCIAKIDTMTDNGRHVLDIGNRGEFSRSILPMLEREQFGLGEASLPVRSDPAKCLEALWALDDADNAEAGLPTSVDEQQRRQGILDRLPKATYKTLWMREYQRKRRANMKKNG